MIANIVHVGVDTTNFVTVKLVNIGPGNEIYSACGHTALRMECKAHNLDICYSYLVPDQKFLVVSILYNGAKQGLARIRTNEYYAEIDDEGRNIEEYELNLSSDEKILLWKLLDEESDKGPYLDYDYINHGCALGVMDIIVKCLKDDTIITNKKCINPENCRSIISGHLKHDLLTGFLMSFVLGEKVNSVSDANKMMLIPSDLVNTIKQAEIVDQDGSYRPFILNNDIIVQKGERSDTKGYTLIIVVLLLLVTSLYYMYIKLNGFDTSFYKIYVTAFNLFMTVMITILALFVASVILISPLYGTESSMLILVYNILPLLSLILHKCNKKTATFYVKLSYLLGLFLFLLLSSKYILPESSLLLGHWLIAISSGIWTVSNLKTN